MLIVKYSIETKATPEAVWKVWADVDNWNTWDHGIDSSTIFGPFATGTRGKVKPKGAGEVHTLLTYVEPMKVFIDEAKLPFTRLIFTHTLSRSGKKTLVSHQIEMKGPLALLFSYLIGRDLKKNLPREMSAMIRKAEGIVIEQDRLENHH